MQPTIIILLSCCMYFTAIDAQHQNPAHLKYMKCAQPDLLNM